MTESRKKTAKAAITADADGTPSAETIRQALEDLGINRPYYTCRVAGSRIELALYGGNVVTWPPPKSRRKS